MKIKSQITSVLALALCSFGFLSLSNAGDAGCGLGSVIIQKNSKGLQLLAWTTNGLLFTQPLGITSGTSGCSSNGIVMNEKEIEYYVEVNQHDLNREIAQGKGEKVLTLANLHGCKTTASEEVFINKLQSQFSKISPSAETKSTEMAANLRNLVLSDTEIKAACAVVAAN